MRALRCSVGGGGPELNSSTSIRPDRDYDGSAFYRWYTELRRGVSPWLVRYACRSPTPASWSTHRQELHVAGARAAVADESARFGAAGAQVSFWAACAAVGGTARDLVGATTAVVNIRRTLRYPSSRPRIALGESSACAVADTSLVAVIPHPCRRKRRHRFVRAGAPRTMATLRALSPGCPRSCPQRRERLADLPLNTSPTIDRRALGLT